MELLYDLDFHANSTIVNSGLAPHKGAAAPATWDTSTLLMLQGFQNVNQSNNKASFPAITAVAILVPDIVK